MKSGFNMPHSIFSRFKGTKITEITYTNNNNAFFIIQYRNNLTGFITEAILSHGLVS